MTRRRTALTTTQLAMTPIFTALVAIVTMAFTISVPATTGYFNVGEGVIYIAAILFGPYVGAISGGVGAAISDALLAPIYWPGTLIIKATEGAIVGFLGRRAIKAGSKIRWKTFTLALGLVTGALLTVIGLIYYTGPVQLFLGIPPPSQPTVTVFVPFEFWYLLGALVFVVTAYVGVRSEPKLGWLVLVIFLGGLEMVTGYFLYETIALGNLLAILEVPVNIGQFLIGLIIAIPVARTVRRTLPMLEQTP